MNITLEQLQRAIDARGIDVSRLDRTIDGVAVDSRKVIPGQVFWALRGERHDGHQFVNAAVEAGAIASVIEAKAAANTTGPRLVVSDTLHTLGQFAAWHRQRQEALVIGVTGSVGKTTTRHMLHHVLSPSFRGVESPQNYNNEIGVPLSLLRIEDDHEFAVIEMGASAVGEIAALAKIACPEVGVLTSVAAAHLEGFGSEKNIALAKSELLRALPSTGFAVINGDCQAARQLAGAAACPVILVGEGADNDLRADQVRVENELLTFRVENHEYRVPVSGRHHLSAALICLAVGREIGLTASELMDHLASFQPLAGRCRSELLGDCTLIDDSYNANPASMQAACGLLASWTGDVRRILVCGDMLELGAHSRGMHVELGRHAAGSGIDHLLAYGNHADDVVAGARASGMQSFQLAACQDLAAVEIVLDCWLEPRDVVLVKGSRGMQMERIVEWLRDRNRSHRLLQVGA